MTPPAAVPPSPHIRAVCHMALFAALLWLAAGATGCAKARYAAQTQLTQSPDEPAYKAVLSDHDQQRIHAALRELAAGHQVVHPPQPAKHGMRWADVPLAAVYACDAVEMAIRRTTKRDAEYCFDLLTIEGWPGTLIVRQTNDERIYEAQATIGRFADRHDRAAALLDAFEEQMRAFGRKRSFAE